MPALNAGAIAGDAAVPMSGQRFPLFLGHASGAQCSSERAPILCEASCALVMPLRFLAVPFLGIQAVSHYNPAFAQRMDMFPKHLRWLFMICAVGNLFVMLFTGLQVYSGTASPSQLIVPIVMIVLFGWMFTQSTKTK